MVIKTLRTNIVRALSLGAILVIATSAFPANSSATDLDLEVDIAEVLSVSITTPDTWASGDVSLTTGSSLLRNKINLNVTCNNASGFSAFMASKTTTNLVNTVKSSSYIETLSSSTTASGFPADRWGYSLDDTNAGSSSANYLAMQTSLISLASPSAPSTVNKDIFFGAKASAAKDSGTYANTVVFSVVSGPVDPVDPVIPDDPVTPADDTTPDDGIATRDGDRMVTTTTASGTQTQPVATSTTTTTTEITPYVAPQGVNVNSGNGLVTGLAIASAATAASGAFFFILAKRKKDDDEEEEDGEEI